MIMDNDNMISNIINKCEIYYDNLLISSEEIIKKYMSFLAMKLNDGQKDTSFVFHTGSMCFDVVAIATLMLMSFAYNMSSNEDVLSSLETGDMVLYSGERYRWNGIILGSDKAGLVPSLEYMHIIQDGKGKNGSYSRYLPYQQNKHKIKPYYGSSMTTDGRGIRKVKNDRNELLSKILDIPEYEVPSVLNISIVVIADKVEIIDICQHLKISYSDDKKFQLTDIIPVSYFTVTGEEMQIGKNPSKTEAVIKAVSKISVARDLILDKHCNNVIGLLALNTDMLTNNSSSFKDLIRRESLRFAIVTSEYSIDSSNLVVEQYEAASIFACTKEMLLTLDSGVNRPNRLTNELGKQISNIMGRQLQLLEVSDGWTWNEYKDIKENICILRQSNWNENEKKEFILNAFSLLNLFASAFFSMQEMEGIIERGLINAMIGSPAFRLRRLKELSAKSLSMKKIVI